MQGQDDLDDRAEIAGAADLDLAIVEFDGTAGDGKAETKATGRARIVGTIEALKNMREMIGRDTDAGIRNEDAGIVASKGEMDADISTGGGKVNGVVDDLSESADELFASTVDGGHIDGELGAQVNVMSTGDPCVPVTEFGKDLVQGKGFASELTDTIEARHKVELLNEVGYISDMLFDSGEVFLLLFGIVGTAISEPCAGIDLGERGSKLV